MRENGVVELPATLPKDTFMKELEYYGFNTEEVNTECITCPIPIFEAITHVNTLHKQFLDCRIEMNLTNDLWVLAYACYCEVVASASLTISFNILCTNTSTITNTRNLSHVFILPQYLLDIDAKLDKQKIWNLSLASTMLKLGELFGPSLHELFGEKKAEEPIHPTKLQFNKCLSYFGFECDFSFYF